MFKTSSSDSDNETAVFALIIGIDEYLATDHLPPLQGAVNDAEEFREFLCDSREKRGLHVPASNIVFLRNRDATRETILESFRSHFLNNPHIPDHGNTTMIMFYAGHGSRVETKKTVIDKMVEGICPVDEGTTDSFGRYVHAIPDYILGWLLRELAEKKGSNITVIFDSCHSGGTGRAFGRARAAASPSAYIPPALDSYLWEDKSDVVPSDDMWDSSATTHVLLAACEKGETAREICFNEGAIRGRFTKSLVEELRKVDLENTTYAELLDRLPSWSGQTPHCGGSRKTCQVFGGNYPTTVRLALPLTPPHPEDLAKLQYPRPILHIQMGTVEGVVPGTEFSAFDGDNQILCTLVALFVQSNQSFLATKNTDDAVIPLGSWAVVPPNFPYAADLFPTDHVLFQSNRYRSSLVQATSPAKAGIIVRGNGDDIDIERLTSTYLEYRRTTRFSLAASGGPSRLPAVMDSIAFFNYLLERRHGSSPIAGVSVEMYRLKGELPNREPDRGFGDNGNLIRNHEAQLPPERGVKFGVKICNASSLNLFPYLFYFNPEMYTVQVRVDFPRACISLISECFDEMWYSPPSNVKAPLKGAGGEVTIGMGAEPAFMFQLPAGMSLSFGVLKLFVSTHILDLDWIQQDMQMSPFNGAFDPRGMNRAKAVRALEHQETWDAFKVTLVMAAVGEVA
ncbi:caspase domain-containing protein [Mycena pura]|uniref:Caspase domain-containing protein n=1 Tax=Mycena pura TaxID=153505 RepID=A0AAD6VLN6_9AGAR|nr:caspase domain-containing protein [Mycena pura]